MVRDTTLKLNKPDEGHQNCAGDCSKDEDAEDEEKKTNNLIQLVSSVTSTHGSVFRQNLARTVAHLKDSDVRWRRQFHQLWRSTHALFFTRLSSDWYQFFRQNGASMRKAEKHLEDDANAVENDVEENRVHG